MALELGVIFALVLVNGVLAGAEIAVVQIDRTYLRQLVEEGQRKARIVEDLRNNPDRFFAAVQIGITVVGATASAFGGSRVARHLEPLVSRIPSLEPVAWEVSLAIVIGFISVV